MKSGITINYDTNYLQKASNEFVSDTKALEGKENTTHAVISWELCKTVCTIL